MDAARENDLLERLRRHLSDKTTDMAPHALRVPAAHYVSDTQYEAEVDALFKKRPLLVALTPHIPNAGDYLAHDVLDTGLLLVRASSGSARAYINACRHRGAVLQRVKATSPAFPARFMPGTGASTANSLLDPIVTKDSPPERIVMIS